MPRPPTYDDALRARLVSTAAAQIAAHGVDSVALRPIAHQAGTSTNAIYTLFGSKAGLVEAVVAEALASFTQAQRAALTGAPPLADLEALGWAYRAWALAHPTLYAVMFEARLTDAAECGDPTAGDAPPDQPDEGIQPLVDAVTRAQAAEALRPSDPLVVAVSIWAATHGWVSLELAGRLPPMPDSDAALSAYLRAVLGSWTTQPAD